MEDGIVGNEGCAGARVLETRVNIVDWSPGNQLFNGYALRD